MAKILGQSANPAYVDASAAGVGWDSHSTLPAPPGTSLGNMAAQGVFSELAQALNLPPVGLFTPWATKEGDAGWEEIRRPDTNVLVWSLSDAAIRMTEQLTFGAPLPFVAVLTDAPLTVGQLRELYAGTAYRYYETQAGYRQDDAGEPPKIYFLHWGERIDMAELPAQVLTLEPRAARVRGVLVFAAQVPSQTTTVRSEPAQPFGHALQMQFTPLPVGPAPAPSSPATPPPHNASSPVPSAPVAPAAAAAAPGTNLVVPLAVGLGAASLAYIIWAGRKAR